MYNADQWKDYELLDTGDGEKLERWGRFVLRRPDPQVICPNTGQNERWTTADGHYHRSSSGGGEWEFRTKMPERWTVSYGELKFHIRPTSFKHTGCFPSRPSTGAG